MQDSIPRTSGIYKITCTVNGRFYIGSSNNCSKRWGYHRRDLRGGKHHSIHLQRAWNKYGEAAFIFEIIETVDPQSLFDREQYWLDTLKPFDERGFNNNPVANRPDWTGHKHTLETRAKMSASQIGHTLSPESRAKISAARIGMKMSLETKEKIGSKFRGRKLSAEHVAKVAAKHIGSKRSPDACRNIGNSKSKNYIATSPDGLEIKLRNLKQFCYEQGLEYTSMSKVATGKATHHQGWKCRYDKEGE